MNNLAGENLFKSGLNFGGGLTENLDIRRNKKGEKFIDTPGLSDWKLKAIAAKAIADGLRQSGDYKVLCVVREENGTVSAEDVVTMKLVLEAAPEIGMNYGIIVNMVSEGTLKDLREDSQDFLNGLFSEIPKVNRCLDDRVLFLGEIEELQDEDNILLPVNDPNSMVLKKFVHNVPKVNIKPENVKDIKI